MSKRILVVILIAAAALGLAVPVSSWVMNLFTSDEGRVPELKASGEYENVTARTFRYNFGGLDLPESDYTVALDFGLGSSFYDLSDPTWWPRAYEAFKEHSSLERGIRKPEDWSIKVVPSLEWLQKNARRYSGVYYDMEFVLPRGGKLQRVVDETEYLSVGHSEEEVFAPMRVRYGGATYYSVLNAIPIPETNRYGESPRYIRQAKDGQLLYRYPDGKRYLIVQLSNEFLNQSESDLDKRPYEETVRVEILKVK